MIGIRSNINTAGIRRAFFAAVSLLLSLAGPVPRAWADMPAGVTLNSMSASGLAYSWTLGNMDPVDGDVPLMVISTSADFSAPVSSAPGDIGQQYVSYTGLNANTIYYFEVKVATEPDATYTAALSTATGIETPTGVYFDEVFPTAITASAYAPTPMFSGLGTGSSGLNVSKDGVYPAWRNSDAWTTKTAMTGVARSGLAAGAIGGKVYAVGGYNLGALDLDRAYDPAFNTWATKQVMPTPRGALAAGVTGGKLYAVGGNNGSSLNTNEEYDPAADAWTAKAAMPTARDSLAAAGLGGKIYAVGGLSGAVLLKINEVYDPVSNSWATKTPMPTFRSDLAAAAIGGKFYAVGGLDSGTPLNANEEYDPATDGWTAKAAMPTARSGLSAAVIGGKLYAAGGNNAGFLKTNEEYDPAADTWTARAPMTTARAAFSAGAAGGRLYAIGGFNGGGYLSTNEEYDPGAAQKFTGLNPNTQYSFQAKARNRLGVETGGSYTVSTFTMAAIPAAAPFTSVTSNTVTVNWTQNGNPAGATLYRAQASTDPAFGVLAASSDTYNLGAVLSGFLPNTTCYARVAAINDLGVISDFKALGSTVTLIETPAGVYFDEVGTSAITASAYGPVFSDINHGLAGVAVAKDAGSYSAWRTGDVWAAKTAMPTLRRDFAVASMGGKIYAIGGFNSSSFRNQNEQYDPAANAWTTLAAMPTPRSELAAAVAGGRLYAIGGSGPVTTNEEYDPESDSWAVKASMPTARRSLVAAGVGGKIYAIGGSPNYQANEEYSPLTNTWAAKPSLPTGRYGAAAAVASDRIYVFGGTSDGSVPLPKNEEYDPASNVWTAKTSMPTARYFLAAAPLGGNVYALGGTSDGVSAGNVSEEYNPVSNTWAAKADLPTARYSLAAAAAGGKVYAIGGYAGAYLGQNEAYDPGVAVQYTGLLPNTQYAFKAKARNFSGTETPASPSTSTYTLAAVPGAPALAARSSTTQNVAWSDSGNPDPGTNYLLKYSTAPDFAASGTVVLPLTSTHTAVTSLLPNTSYYYAVAAVNNAGAQTPYAGHILSSSTLAAVPGALSITAITSTTQHIAWDSAGNPDPGTNYVLEYSTSSNFTPAVTTAAVFASTFTTVSGLASGTSYYYDVAAVSRDGIQTVFTGSPAAGFTLPAPPGAPVPSVLQTYSISWTWPAATGATSYKIYAASAPAAVIGSAVSNSFVETGLSTNTLNGILVSAVDPVGESAKSVPVSTYTFAAAPVNLSTGPGAPDTTALDIRWGSNGNPLNTQYTLDYWPYAGSTTTVTTTLTGATLSGLTEATSYYFQVRAQNQAGFVTNKAGPLLMPTLPGAPTGLSAEVLNTSSIRWTWSAVPTAVSYNLYGGLGTVIGASQGTLFTETGLSSNTLNGVFVSAVNLAGESVKSVAVDTYTFAAAPGAPVITASSDRTQSLQWNERGNPFGNIYLLKYSTSPAFTASVTTTASVNSAVTVVSGLVPNTSYYYDVAAVNSSGIQTAFTGVPVSSYTMAAVPGSPVVYGAAEGAQSVSWAPNSNPSPDTRYRVEYSTSAGFEAGVTTVAVLTSTFNAFSGLTANTLYYYDAAAVNHIGVQTPFTGTPGSGYTTAAVPGNPGFTGWTDTTQTLQWASGGNPNPGTDYRIEYSTSPGFAPSVSSATVSPSTFTTVTGLTPGTSYYYRVASINKVGGLSAFAGFILGGYTLPPPPGAPAASVLGVSSISWTWSASTSAVSYKIYYTQDPDTVVASPSGPPFVALNLSTNAFNSVMVSAVNPAGEGAKSQATTASTLCSAPGAPSITGRGATTQDIKWDNNGNPAVDTNYILRYSTSPDFFAGVTTSAVTISTNVTVTGLVAGTRYYYDVAAVNQDSVQTVFTAPVSGYTLPPAPAAPAPSALGVSSISWTWSASTSAVSYNIYAASDTSLLTSVAGPSFAETGLPANTYAGILVAAVNPDGEGARSVPVSTYTLAGVPGAPSFTGRSSASQSLRWPANGNPLPGTSYVVRYSTSPDFIPSASATVPSTFTAIGGLLANTSYFYDVAARNGSGFLSAFSGAPVSGYTLAAVPGFPFIVANSSSSQEIDWHSGVNPQPGTDYLLRYSTSALFTPSVTTMTVVHSTFTTVTGLAANTSYYFDVAGITVDSALSAFTGDPAAGYTLAATPGAPFITGRSSTTQNVQWSDGGNPDPGTSYQLKYSTSANFTPAVTTVTVLASTFTTITGLAAGTSYYYDAAAYNSAGLLTPFTGTPGAGYTLPDAPAAPAGTGTGASSILWTWAPVQSAASYKIYPATNTATVIGTSFSPSFTEAGLSTNTVNGVVVSAVNPAGEGAQSPAASTCTLSALPVALSTGPDVTTDVSITVQWGVNTNPPGTQYQVDYWTPGGSTVSVVTALSSAALTGLTGSTSYYIWVRAANNFGLLTAPAALLLPTMPGAPSGLAGTGSGAGSINWSWDAVPTASLYRIYAATEPATVIGTSASPSFSENGLSTNTLNGILVSAVNLSGESPQSSAASIYTLSAMPVALSTGPDAATTGSVTVQWGANTNPPGIQYQLDYWTAGGATATVTTALTSATLSGLAQSTTYYIWARALNDAGALTAPAVLQVPTVSGSPANLFGTVLGTGSIRWEWVPVPTAVSYYLYAAGDPATVISTVTAPLFLQAGLSPNTNYDVTAAAVNAAGVGPQSDAAVSVWTYARPPAGETVSAVNISSASLTWGLNGNPSYTEADVERSTDNLTFGNVKSGPYTDPDFTGTDPVTFSAPDLSACTTYYFRIYNKNGSGRPTVYSSTLTFFTSGLPPLPPGSLTAESLAGNTVLLSWDPSPSGMVTRYALYYDNGGGTIDYGTPLAVLSSTVTSYTTGVLAPADSYKFGLRAALCGNEEHNTGVVAAAASVSALSAVRAAIKIPQAGKKLYGDRVTLMAELAQGAGQARQVLFQYKVSTDSVWLNLAAANAAHPNPATEPPYLVQCDVSGFPATGYDLRAVATDLHNSADPTPPYISVQVDPSDPDIAENSQGGGQVKKEQKIYNAVVNTVEAADGGTDQITDVVIPAGALADSTATVSVTNNPSRLPPVPAGAQGCGVAAQISLSNGQTLLSGGRTAAVTLSFADSNNDGLVDGTNVRTDSLEIYSAAAVAGPWKKDFSSVVDLAARTVTGRTPHFSFFALFAPLAADLSGVEVYPVPFIPKDGNPDTGVAYSAGNPASGIIFDRLPGSVHIKIYTVTGQLVAHFGSDSSSGKLQWNVKNDDGHYAASGGYIAVISSPGHKDAVKKILVVR